MNDELTTCTLGRLTPAGETLSLALPSGDEVPVPLVRVTYPMWTGALIADTYGGKPVVVDATGNPTFAELAILRDLEAQDWHGVWVDSYRSRLLTAWPPVLGDMDRRVARRFDAIAQLRQGKSWDVVAWCGKRILFVEAKRRGKDKIRDGQRAWLDAAVRQGFSVHEFLVVEWTPA